MEFYATAQALKCPNCGREVKIENNPKDVVEHSLDVHILKTIKVSEKTSTSMECEGCGAMVEVDATSSATTCPYCGSHYVLSKKQIESIVPDGVIPFKELTSAEKLEEVLNNIKVGDTIKAKVIKLKNEDNYVVLSRLEFEKEEALGYLEKVYENNEELTIKVTAAKEKGLVAYYNGVRIFIPSSQIDIKYVEDKESLVGTEMTVKLIDFSKENLSKIVASRKTLLEEAKAKKENITWDSLQVGDIVKAEIKRFTNFGAFAEVDGVDGLIHLSQISWSHIKSCEEVLKIGQIVDVKIINLDKDAKKLSLSIKELTPEPWSVVDEKYSEGSAVLGKVVRINDFGAFVELEPGIDGLVHISKISHDHIKHPSEVLSIGEEVKCIILSIDKENKKIALSIKDAE